jgi:type VI secretion system secreted protein Hcp
MPPSIPSSVAAPGEGAVDVFLAVQSKRSGKIRGEATAVDHKDEIQITSWDWGVTASSALGSTQATARRSYRNLAISKRVDSSTTALLSVLASNDEIKEAKLCMRKAGEGQRDFFKITLYNARVTSVDLACDSTGMLTERATLSFNRVQVEYEIQQASGQRGSGFNFNDEILPV